KNLVPKGVNIPSGFIVTASAYRYFLKATKLDIFIKDALAGLNTANLKDLSRRGKIVREAIVKQELPADLKEQIRLAYAEMEKRYGADIDTAVRSSATAEDLPGASFAGEHDTYLGIRGAENVILAVKSAMASLFTDRAISYRVDKGFDHFQVALSVGIERMVRSDKGCSGVMFTLDTESGFKDTVIINGSWGLGEMIVQGEVTPDEFIVAKKTLRTASNPIIFKKLGGKMKKMIYGAGGQKKVKPTKVVATSAKERDSFVLTDAEIKTLAEWGVKIEEHYTARNKKWTPMDTEWAKDGLTGELFIVQARPETIHAERDFSKIREYVLKEQGKLIVKGASVGSKIAVGQARVILSAKNIGQFKKGEVLVTDMTDPDWEPIMKIASAIVTDKGGRTSHAAIVSRELGIPAIVGSESATRKIKTGQMITVDTSGAEGLVFDGGLKFEVIEHNIKTIPRPKTKIMMNIATPDTAFEKSFLPNSGVGLAREEFIIASSIGIHPLALINYKKMSAGLKKKI
ncbi:MAG: phosphoenolpyruvate synthase, partial [Legionella sp.]